jgi:hypothetical protein
MHVGVLGDAEESKKRPATGNSNFGRQRRVSSKNTFYNKVKKKEQFLIIFFILLVLLKFDSRWTSAS